MDRQIRPARRQQASVGRDGKRKCAMEPLGFVGFKPANVKSAAQVPHVHMAVPRHRYHRLLIAGQGNAHDVAALLGLRAVAPKRRGRPARQIPLTQIGGHQRKAEVFKFLSSLLIQGRRFGNPLGQRHRIGLMNQASRVS